MHVANHPLAKAKTVTACRQIAAGDFLLRMRGVKGQRQAQCAGFQQSIHPRGRRREILSFAPQIRMQCIKILPQGRSDTGESRIVRRFF
ncbi:Uncharacterised protein [Shigella sonnei]|nr:Uncharacterised protein [Shigella sonnei]